MKTLDRLKNATTLHELFGMVVEIEESDTDLSAFDEINCRTQFHKSCASKNPRFRVVKSQDENGSVYKFYHENK